MTTYPAEITGILDTLKANPRGMSVTELSRALALNRNTLSRYLDMLRIAGEVEMRTYGKAKVFYPSQRVPLSAMINFSSDGVAILDRDLVIVQANDRILEIVRAGREEVIGKPIGASRLSAFDHPLIRARIEDALGGQDVVEEVRFLRPDGELFFRMKVLPTAFNDGSPGITILLEEITAQKRVEEALRAGEAKFRALVEDINDVIWNVDDGWCFSYVSPKSFDLLGYAPDEMEGKPLLQFVPSPEREHFAGKLEEAVGRREPFSLLHIPILHRTGRHLVFEANGTPDFDEIGEFAGYRMVARDVTERRQAERRVLGWKSFLHSVVQNIPDMVFVRETEGGAYVLVNRAGADFVGATPGSLTGKQAEEIFRADLIPFIRSGEDEAIARRTTVACPECRVRMNDGEVRHLQAKKIPIAANGGPPRYLLTIIRDVTAHVRAGAHLREQRDFAAALGTASDLPSALSICLEAAMRANGVDAVAVYAVGEGGRLDLTACSGFSAAFPEGSGRLEGRASAALLARSTAALTGGEPFPVAFLEEGLSSLSSFSITHSGTPLAVLVAGSRRHRQIPADGYESLQVIAAQAANVAGRIMAQETVRKERDLAERYLDVARVMIAVIGTDGRIERMNRTGCQVLGYREVDLLGRNWFATLVPPSLRPRLEANFRRLMDGVVLPPGEEMTPLLDQDGSEIGIIWHNAVLRDENGAITGIVSSGTPTPSPRNEFNAPAPNHPV
ncbi:PAS domain S-box protein [Methanofollis fontis]|nr:PAS domain S-box protein [Methanofollis fontis]